MARQATDRIVGGLYWTGRFLLAGGGFVIVGAIAWTRESDALLLAAQVAGWGFLLPAVASIGLASLLSREAAGVSDHDGKTVWARLAGQPHPYREPARSYAIAIAAVVVAGVVRAAAAPYLHFSVPYVTFFLAIAVTGWLAGFGPAMAATVLSAIAAVVLFIEPVGSLRIQSNDGVVGLGLFLFVAVGLSAITATLHAALRRLRDLDAQIAALKHELHSTTPVDSMREDTSTGNHRDRLPRS